MSDKESPHMGAAGSSASDGEKNKTGFSELEDSEHWPGRKNHTRSLSLCVSAGKNAGMWAVLAYTEQIGKNEG